MRKFTAVNSSPEFTGELVNSFDNAVPGICASCLRHSLFSPSARYRILGFSHPLDGVVERGTRWC